MNNELSMWLDKRFSEALRQRHELNIDARLRMADLIWDDGILAGSNCKKDTGINHLKKKVWTLYSMLLNQLKMEGDEAVSLDAVEPDVKDLSDEIANQMLDDMVTAAREGVDELSIETALTTIESLFRRNKALVVKSAGKQLSVLQEELRLSMLNGRSNSELKKVLFDYCLYPNCFILAAYKTRVRGRSFKRGRITAFDKEKYTFDRLDPKNVYPVHNTTTCSEWFILQEYCVADFKSLRDSSGSNKSNIDEIIDNYKKYNNSYYVGRYGKPYTSNMSLIPVYKYFGYIPKEKSGESEDAYGEVWMVGDKEIYRSIGKDDTAVVLTESFRRSNNSIWGSGTVDTGWRIQQEINKLSAMRLENIGYRSKPGGMLPETLAKYIAKGDRDGKTKINYDRFYTVPDEVARQGLRPMYFDVPDRTYQIQQTIEANKADMDSLLGIPAFVDGSSNVGTLGRTSGGLFLVQKNMMQNIESLWDNFSDSILVALAEYLINGHFLLNKMTSTLDFRVIVRNFNHGQEELEDADSLIKKTSAIMNLGQSGLVDPSSAQQIAQLAAEKLGASAVVDPQPAQQPEPQGQQLFTG